MDGKIPLYKIGFCIPIGGVEMGVILGVGFEPIRVFLTSASEAMISPSIEISFFCTFSDKS
jgi:hypothetical protein